MAKNDKKLSVFVCKGCGEPWKKDKNGLVMDFALKSPKFYGYWTPISEKSRECCPACDDGHWEYIEVDADANKAV